MLLNPVIAMLHNSKTRKFHPIIFVESPLPGGGGPIRHKSKGHHAEGFDSRVDAMNSITQELVPAMARVGDSARQFTGPDLEWDGEGLPASTEFFDSSDLKELETAAEGPTDATT